MDELGFDLTPLLRRWWVAAMIFIIFVAGAGIIAFTRDDQFEARSKLLIVAPVSSQVTGGQQAPSLSVATLNALTTANDLLLNIITTLSLREESSGEPWAVERLARMLRPKVETAGTGIQETSLPLLTMVVQGSDPAQIKNIADTWAELFVGQNAQFFAAETARSFEFLETQYEETELGLDDLQERLLAFNNSNPILLMEDELGFKQSDLREYLGTYLSTSVDLTLRRDEYQNSLNRIAELTVDGKWIGFGPIESGDSTDSAYSQERQELVELTEQLFQTEAALKAVEQTNALTLLEQRQNNELTEVEFQLDNELSFLQSSLVFQRELLTRYTSSLESAEISLKLNTGVLEALLEELQDQPQFFVLHKSIDDTALFQQLGPNPTIEQLERLQELGLETEQINPAYTELIDRIIATRVNKQSDALEVDLLAGKVIETERETKSLELSLANLEQIQLASLRQDLNLQYAREEQDLAATLSRKQRELLPVQSRYDAEIDRFIQLTANLPNQRDDVRRLEIEEKQFQGLFDQSRVEWEALSLDIATAKLEVDRFNRQISTLGSSLSQLAERRQAARIAKSEQEGSILIVESAVEPMIPVGSGRSFIVAAGGALGLFLGISGAFVFDIARRSPLSRNEPEVDESFQ